MVTIHQKARHARKSSLRLKMGGQFIALITVILIGFGGYQYYDMRSRMTRELSVTATTTAAQLAASLSIPLWGMDVTLINQLMTASMAENNIYAILIHDPDGKQLLYGKVRGAQWQITDLDEKTWAEETRVKTGGMLSADAKIVKEERPYGLLNVYMTRQFIQAQLRRQLVSLIVLVFLTDGIALFFVWVVTLRITRPILNLLKMAQAIAVGDFGQEFSVRQQDEIGMLVAAFNQLIVYLREMAATATAISQGTLSQKVVARSEQDVLGQAFLNMTAYLSQMASLATTVADGDLTQTVALRSTADAFGQAITAMTTGLHTLIMHIKTSATQIVALGTSISEFSTNDLRIVRDVQNSATEMIATIRALGESVRDVADRMEELSSSVETTSSSVAEMGPSIRHIVVSTTELARQASDTSRFLDQTVATFEQIVHQTKVSSDLSQRTIQDAIDGQEAINEVNASMEVLHTTIKTAMEAITRFANRSQDIGTILDVIREVTDQTALLALNAAIIAAQAGTQGRGFAVVAEEIKNLAQSVNASTKDIAQIVRTLQEETGRVVQTIHDGSGHVEQGVVRARKAQHALDQIMSSAQQSSKVVTEIAEALKTLMQDHHTVASAMQEVKSLTDTIQTATHQQETTTLQMNQAIVAVHELASRIQQATRYQASGLQNIFETTNNVAALIDQNFESSQQITWATESLAIQAERLLQATDRFRLTT